MYKYIYIYIHIASKAEGRAPSTIAATMSVQLYIHAHIHICMINVDSPVPTLNMAPLPSMLMLAHKGPAALFEHSIEFNYQNHGFCRFPITCKWDFSIGTYKKDGYGRQW